MRLSVFAALLGLAVAVPARAQSADPAPDRPDVPVTAHPGSVYVVAPGAGAAVRVTTYGRRPSIGDRLDRYRGVRVFRSSPAPRAVVEARPTLRVTDTPEGRFVRHGGASYPVVRR